MHAHFGTAVVVVIIVAVVLAIVAMASSGSTWSEYGQGGMVKDRDAPRQPRAGASSAAERETDIRSMLEARNARRERRGQPPLDVDAELARLTSPRAGPGRPPRPAADPPGSAPSRPPRAAADTPGGRPAPPADEAPAPRPRSTADAPDALGPDPELREEVRQLVVARNHRRVRAGKPALDVKTEVERELRRFRDL